MATASKEKFIEAVGKRKTAIARIRIAGSGKGSFIVNDRPLEKYFPTAELQHRVTGAISKIKDLAKLPISAKIVGGGPSSQAEALRHSLARVLVKMDSELKAAIKKEKLLSRDARIKERRKFGLKKARKAPQWSKR